MESLTPNSTKQHENTPPEEQITPVQMSAVTLRAEGKKYSEISTTIDVPEETVKNWFRDGHSVFKHYQKYCYKTSYFIGLEAEREIQRMTELATETLRELMSDFSPPAVRSRVCDYVLKHTFKHVDSVLLVRATKQQEIENFNSLKNEGFYFTESKRDEMAKKEQDLKDEWG